MPRITHGETYGTEVGINLEVIRKELARLGGKDAEVQLRYKLAETGDYGKGPFVLVDVRFPKFPKGMGQTTLGGIAVFKNSSGKSFELSSSYLLPIPK